MSEWFPIDRGQGKWRRNPHYERAAPGDRRRSDSRKAGERRAMVDDQDPQAAGEAQGSDENERIPAMQRVMDSPFLLLFLGVTVPTVFYLIWGLIEIAHVPMAPSAYAATNEGQPANAIVTASVETKSAPVQSSQSDLSSAGVNANSAPAPAVMTLASVDEAAPDEVVESLAARMANADAANGERVAKRCLVCHSTENGGANRVGPNLWSIVGRDIGAADGFRYSPAMAPEKGAWTFEMLDTFLANPRAMLSGNRMADPGIKRADHRADVILYLRNLSDDPKPLPE